MGNCGSSAKGSKGLQADDVVLTGKVEPDPPSLIVQPSGNSQDTGQATPLSLDDEVGTASTPTSALRDQAVRMVRGAKESLVETTSSVISNVKDGTVQLSTTLGVPLPTLMENKLVAEKTARLQAVLRGRHARQSMKKTVKSELGSYEFSGGEAVKKEKLPGQAGGHPGVFQPQEDGCLCKETAATEARLYELVQGTELQTLVPGFFGSEPTVPKPGVLSDNRLVNLRMQNLTAGCNKPCVMDIKMGVRTFLESEVHSNKMRLDLVEKMVKLDPNCVTEQEKAEGVTKLRYMQFREERSSTHSHGWRIEAIVLPKESSRLPKKLDTKLLSGDDQLSEALAIFVQQDEALRSTFLKRLQEMYNVLEESALFSRLELIGSSVLFIYDADTTSGYQPNAWMIDFAKTVELPQSEGSEAEKRLSRRSSRFADDPDNYKVPRHLSHRKMWLPANHEDGYLLGLDSLINAWGAERIKSLMKVDGADPPSLALLDPPAAPPAPA